MVSNTTLNSKILSTFLLIWAILSPCFSQNTSTDIRLNQLGFYPDAPKIAIVPGNISGGFSILTADTQERMFEGALGKVRTSSISGKTTRSADFSAFKTPGKYILFVPSLGLSYPFEIKENVHLALATAALKGFYYQRMSMPLQEEYAGIWHRPLPHPDNKVFIHPSAASKNRPAGTVISSPGGWYDAGDYNKYIVNSGITMGTLLSLYEDFPDYFKTLETNIPETGNPLPDLLDEVLWNLRWMLTMQDPNDGGVYHKCTTANFEGFVKPQDAHAQRFVVQKSTSAALDFAAVMAQSARIFKAFGNELPGLADSCLSASNRAWEWALEYPDSAYNQGKLNEKFDPGINTGAYGDSNFMDEFIWAAVELYVTTHDGSYLQPVELFPPMNFTIQNWSDVRTMAYFTLLRNKDKLTPAASDWMPDLFGYYVAFANGLVEKTAQQAYLSPVENDVKNFVWGSTAVCANQGMALIYAYKLTGEKKFLDHALADLDYLLGRNATGYSFVTGFGSKSPMHPHHRPSEADGVEPPVPGLLVGGPNPGQQDKCPGYPNNFADESYLDDVCSYASNEIAINWNAPLVYLAFVLDILESRD